jgi:hypothetical protein
MVEEVVNYIARNAAPDVIESQDYTRLSYFLIQRKLQGNNYLQDVPITLTLRSADYRIIQINGHPEFSLSRLCYLFIRAMVILLPDILASKYVKPYVHFQYLGYQFNSKLPEKFCLWHKPN